MTKNPTKQAIIYTRFSPRPSKKAEDTLTIEMQESRCRDYCSAKGIEVVAHYSDESASGKSVKKRPEFRAAVDHVKKIRGILVAYDLSRISRKALDQFQLIDSLDRRKASIMTVHDSLDTTTTVGKTYARIMGIFAEMWRENQASVTKDAMNNRLKMGLQASHKPPFGYSYVDGKTVENEQETPILAEIRSMVFDGKNTGEIAATLNGRGYKNRSGRDWTRDSLRRIVKRIKDDIMIHATPKAQQ
tara:strand:- start:1775 stop:2509 length:735 start_codon:yes stop_codon:yes gene_type:complete